MSHGHTERLGQIRAGISRALGIKPAGAPLTPDDTTAHRIAAVDSGLQRTRENADSPIVYPVLGEIHTPREHALALLSYALSADARSKSFSARDLQTLHLEMCEVMGWAWRKWPAIGRELKGLGLVTATVSVDGERLTYYEIQPVAEPSAEAVPMPCRRA
jgi:hypothetical protein